MLAIERKQKIISLLRSNKKVRVSELSKTLNVTDETIRKDLKELEATDILVRSHGGAILKNRNIIESFLERETVNLESKLTIARLAQNYIQDGMTLMVDTSTTAKLIIQNVDEKKNITVITNSHQLLSECSIKENIKFIATGGEVSHHYKAYVGSDCLKTIKGYNANLAVVGCHAASIGKGTMENNREEADVKRAMVSFSNKVLLVADTSKFDRISLINTLEFRDIDYALTDTRLPELWIDFFEQQSIEYMFGTDDQYVSDSKRAYLNIVNRPNR